MASPKTLIPLPFKSRLLRYFSVATLILPLFLYSGCSNLNCTRLENVLGGNTNLIKFSYTIAENLVQRAQPPLMPRQAEMPVLVTTFVNNSDLTQTSSFGRVLQEHLASRLVQLGYTVREIKLADTLRIEPKSGETILTRDISKIKGGQQAQAILVGTVTRSDRILYISARLINPVNNNIIASDDYQLCMDKHILTMFGLKYQENSDSPVKDPGQPFLNSIL